MSRFWYQTMGGVFMRKELANSDKFACELINYVTPVEQHMAEALRALKDQNKELEVLKISTHTKDSLIRLKTNQETAMNHILTVQSIHGKIKELIKSFTDGQVCEDRNKAAEGKRKAKVYVQFLMPGKVEQMSSLQQDLEEMLSSRFKQKKQKLEINIVEDYGDVKSNKPLLIFCINVSRLGTDVQTTLCGLNLSKNQVLIVFHHQDTHALQTQPSELLLTSSNPAYKNLGGIFDMAFLSERGIYTCDMNDKAVGDLVNFINTMS